MSKPPSTWKTTSVGLPENELEDLRSKAAAVGKSVNRFIRDAILAAVKRKDG